MASFTISRADKFPSGTSVSAYPASNWLQWQLPPSGSPQGSATATATASASTVAFSGLADGTRYYAYAQVGGVDTYVGFATDAAVAGSGASSLSPTTVKTANYTAAAGDLVPVDTTSGVVTVTLPTAPADRAEVAVKLVAVGASPTVTIARGGSDVFNKAGGSTSLTLTLLNQAVVLQYGATAGVWYVISTDVPLSGLDARYQLAGTGAGILNLTADPSSTDGGEGGWAFNSVTGKLFGPKVGTSWGTGYPLNGEEISLGGGLPAETMMENYASLMQNGARSMASGRYFAMRHRPKRTRVTTKARFIVSTAAGADDAVEIAVFNAAVGGARLAYLSATTGKLNSTGVKEVSLSMTWDPSVDYYAFLRCGTLGGTAASLTGRAFQTVNDAILYGSVPPLLLCGYQDAVMPTTTPGTGWQTSLSGFPLLWFVE